MEKQVDGVVVLVVVVGVLVVENQLLVVVNVAISLIRSSEIDSLENGDGG